MTDSVVGLFHGVVKKVTTFAILGSAITFSSTAMAAEAADADASLPLDPRKTVFVGGVPRPLKAVELAMIMDR